MDGDSAEKNAAAENGPIHIDREGNLQLIVGPDAVKMQVDANALRRASKFFSTMLFGPFRESQQTEDWTVELPEDDPEALRVIFNAAHGNFGRMPHHLTLSKFYNVTVMADKYAMLDLLQPWASAWISGLEYPYLILSEVHLTSYQELQKLVILYFLGTSRKFEEFFAPLVVKSRANANGFLLFDTDEEEPAPGGEWRDVDLLPDSIISKPSNEIQTQNHPC